MCARACVCMCLTAKGRSQLDLANAKGIYNENKKMSQGFQDYFFGHTS